MKRVTVPDLKQMKLSGEKVVVLTAYDYATAKIIDETGVDVILVGDSVGNVIQGRSDTLSVTLEQMIYHTKIVSRGVSRAHLCTDMPFMSYQLSKEEALRNAGRLIKEARAHSVKLETTEDYLDTMHAIQRSGIPVMGHIGLLPQSIHVTGGYKIRGREPNEADRLVRLAKSAEDAGAFSIVLEGIPEGVSKKITEAVDIPTIGIGAGPFCDGQVLVINDLLGLSPESTPRFVKEYTNLREEVSKAVRSFAEEVREGVFPGTEHTVI